MIKMNMIKIRDTNKQLKDENNSIERRYRSIICYTFLCSNPATHLLVKGGCPNYFEYFICRKCVKFYYGLSSFDWDNLNIVDVYKLM